MSRSFPMECICRVVSSSGNDILRFVSMPVNNHGRLADGPHRHCRGCCQACLSLAMDTSASARRTPLPSPMTSVSCFAACTEPIKAATGSGCCASELRRPAAVVESLHRRTGYSIRRTTVRRSATAQPVGRDHGGRRDVHMRTQPPANAISATATARPPSLRSWQLRTSPR